MIYNLWSVHLLLLPLLGHYHKTREHGKSVFGNQLATMILYILVKDNIVDCRLVINYNRVHPYTFILPLYIDQAYTSTSYFFL